MRDTEIFQDFLRDLDQEQRHTLHLVYTLKRTPSAENRGQVNPQIVSCCSFLPNFIILRTYYLHTQNVLQAETTNVLEDGLRHRNATSIVPPPLASQEIQQAPQEWVVANGQFPVWANQPAATDPVTQQLLWWQQTYAQQYWAQYMHYISNGQQFSSTNTPAVLTPAVSPSPPVAAPAENNRPQQEPQRRPPLPAVGGVAQEDDEDGGIRAARDWLDWVYVSSRLAILLGVMYYYSSLPRFMLVTLIVAGIYLYQKALHQRRNAVGQVREVIDNVAERNREDNDNADQVDGLDAPVADAVPNNPGDADPIATTERVQSTRVTPSGFNVALNLLIGFFTSLIPEVPAPEALN